MRYLLFLLTFVFCTHDALALKQFRCNGRVQYQPCTENSRIPMHRNDISEARASRRIPQVPPNQIGIKGLRYAEVTEQHFKKLSKDRGQWSGKFRGNGFVELTLEGRLKGKVVHTQYMGGLWLKNRPSTYNYKGPLPKSSKVSWQVIAKAQ